MQGLLTEAHPSARPYLPGSELCPRLFDQAYQTQGVGGRVSIKAEDFMVHEIPKYLLSQEGEHCMVYIIKSERNTEEAVQAIAEATGVLSKDIAYAGRKDKHALTTQWLSVPCSVDQVKSNDDQVQIISAYPHKQKMRLGHNLGNLFSILISDINPDCAFDMEIE
jgi:tRNA pseudouridine13 synthase